MIVIGCDVWLPWIPVASSCSVANEPDGRDIAEPIPATALGWFAGPKVNCVPLKSMAVPSKLDEKEKPTPSRLCAEVIDDSFASLKAA